jgi:hypothetical protein
MQVSELGWVGKKVRHPDGRAGTIRGEFIGFGFAGLTLAVDGGGEAYVQMNVQGADGGEAGWQWWCANLFGGPDWLPLGDQPAPDTVPGSGPGMRR